MLHSKDGTLARSPIGEKGSNSLIEEKFHSIKAFHGRHLTTSEAGGRCLGKRSYLAFALLWKAVIVASCIHTGAIPILQHSNGISQPLWPLGKEFEHQ